MNQATPGLAIDARMLTPLVREALGQEQAEISSWTEEILAGGYGEAARGVFRFYGEALVGNNTHAWSMILKVLSPGEGEIAADTNTPSGWNYWKREALAHESGISQTLPQGLKMPRCFSIQDQPDGTCWLWMENVPSAGRAGSVEHSARVARLLGQFNGTYLTDSARGKTLSEPAWLSRRWLYDFIIVNSSAFEQLKKFHHHPFVSQFYPADIQSFLFSLWAKKDAYFRIYHSLPQAFCHRDVFARNILLQPNTLQGCEYYLIDWNFCGFGPLGEELVSLYIANLAFGETAFGDAIALKNHILDDYIQGLAEAGWQGDPRVVQLAFSIGSAMRYSIGLLRGFLPIFLLDGYDPEMPSFFRDMTWSELGSLSTQLYHDVYIPMELDAHRLAGELGYELKP